MNKLYKFIIASIIIFPVVLISREFYLISVLSPMIILYIKNNYSINLQNTKLLKFRVLYVIIISYSIYTMLLTKYIDSKLLLFSFNKVITLILFIYLIILFTNCTSSELEQIKSSIMISIIIIAGISIIMYYIGIDGVTLGIKPKIVTGVDNIFWYGERRIQWLYEHKIQFSSMCIIGIYLLINNKELNIIKKGLFLLIISYSIYLSNSKMVLVGILLIMIFKLLINNIDNFRKIDSSVKMFFWYTAFCVSILCILVFLIYSNNILEYIGRSRDLTTLGNRTIIWENVIVQIKNNLSGIIKSYGVTFNNGLFLYTTAHNTILNEFLETGIIGGSLYLIIVIISFSMIKGYKNIFIFLLLFGLGLFDYLISGLFSYIFWCYTAILISESTVRSSKSNLLYKETSI